MQKRVSSNAVLELRAKGISMRKSETLLHTSRQTIANVYISAYSKSILWENIKELDEDDVFDILFPPQAPTSTFEEVDCDYIHSELKKTGVTLNLLWNEYCNHCHTKGFIPCGYTKFCKGYSNYVTLTNVTNHLTHKPGVMIETDWL